MTATVIALVGPTAIGKSRIALQVAPLYQGEIVSIDSMQVYRGMNIGTAKPTPAESRLVTHHLIDIIDPTRMFSVAEFQNAARTAINQILARGATPFLVGGSGLYLRAALYDINIPAPPASAALRQEYSSRMDEESRQRIFDRLREVDPVSAERIGPHNLRRIIRALEVFDTTGMPFSSFQRDYESILPRYPSLVIGLTTDRFRLKEQIDRRVDMMIESGLVEEVTRLAEEGGFSDTSRQALGYREVLEYLDNKASLDETIDKIKSNTRRFAKRQMTWFRKDGRIHWIELTGDYLFNYEAASRLVIDYIDVALEKEGS